MQKKQKKNNAFADSAVADRVSKHENKKMNIRFANANGPSIVKQTIFYFVFNNPAISTFNVRL